MKKIVLMVVAAMMATMNVNAQNEDLKHEISVSYGSLSNSDWISIFEDIMTVPFSGSVKRENETFYGPIGVEYMYRLDKTISVGGMALYGHRGYDLYEETSNGKTARGKMTDNYFTVMPAIKFTWLNKSHFGLYSKAALGATLRSEKNDDIHYSESAVHINWHATLIGVEFGGTQFRGFCDFGFGEQGVLSAGLRYKF